MVACHHMKDRAAATQSKGILPSGVEINDKTIGDFAEGSKVDWIDGFNSC